MGIIIRKQHKMHIGPQQWCCTFRRNLNQVRHSEEEPPSRACMRACVRACWQVCEMKYARLGLTRVVYAFAITSCEHIICRFLLIIPRVVFALEEMLLMWVFRLTSRYDLTRKK